MSLILDGLKTIIDQGLYIPSPAFTEHDPPSQDGKVFIITGGYQGLGLSLARLLYSHPSSSTIYIAARSHSKYNLAVASLKSQYPETESHLAFLKLDLSHLSTIRASAEEFMRLSPRLDVLTNNAGVYHPGVGSVTAQGFEMRMGVNRVGTLMLTKSLLPVLRKTAKFAQLGSVRVTWASPIVAYASAPVGGVGWDEKGIPKVWEDEDVDYGQSKAGSVLLAREAARRWRDDGVVGVSWNPGNLKTTFYENLSWFGRVKLWLLMFDPIFGARTELYAGWSPGLTMDNSGAFVIPWGRIGRQRVDIEEAMVEVESETSGSARFWEWCHTQTKGF